jgi:hypothetical protein
MPSHVENAFDVLAASLTSDSKTIPPKNLPSEILSDGALEEVPLNWERLAWAGVIARVQELLNTIYAH